MEVFERGELRRADGSVRFSSIGQWARIGTDIE
jgi:hypothetical protein